MRTKRYPLRLNESDGKKGRHSEKYANKLDPTYTIPEGEQIIQEDTIPEIPDKQDNQMPNDPSDSQMDPDKSMSEKDTDHQEVIIFEEEIYIATEDKIQEDDDYQVKCGVIKHGIESIEGSEIGDDRTIDDVVTAKKQTPKSKRGSRISRCGS